MEVYLPAAFENYDRPTDQTTGLSTYLLTTQPTLQQTDMRGNRKDTLPINAYTLELVSQPSLGPACSAPWEPKDYPGYGSIR